MTNKDRQIFDVRYSVGIGSGLASALLFVAAWKQGTLAALFLAGLAPLPIMIATLGFGAAAGLVAAIVAALTFFALVAAAATHPLLSGVLFGASLRGLGFALCLSLPSWLIARLAATGKPHVIWPWFARVAGLPQRAKEPSAMGPVRVTCPFGDVLMLMAAVAFFAMLGMLITWVARYGGYEAALNTTAAQLQPLIADALASRELPKNVDVAALPRLVLELMPVVAASLIVFVLAGNLWLAGRVAELSNKLPHPWPDIPRDLRVPRFAAGLFVLCFALSFLRGFPGMIAGVAAAALGAVFVLQGLAVLHDLSRGMRFRALLLFGLYLAVALLLPWPLFVFALIGLAEAAFGLRDRKALSTSTKQ